MNHCKDQNCPDRFKCYRFRSILPENAVIKEYYDVVNKTCPMFVECMPGDQLEPIFENNHHALVVQP